MTNHKITTSEMKKSELGFWNTVVMRSLILAASNMLLSYEEVVDVRGDGFEGKIFTEFKEETIRDSEGIFFRATLQTLQGVKIMNFILTEPFTPKEVGEMVFAFSPILDKSEKQLTGDESLIVQ